MKLAKLYYIGTIVICSLNLLDSIRLLAGHFAKPDLVSYLSGVIVSVWVIVALLVLVESIREEKAVPAALFYVVTMATFLMTGPILPSSAAMTRVIEGVIMFANIVVHAWLLAKLQLTKD